MSEPIRKPGHQPESYNPKDAPEIMRLVEEAQGQAGERGASQATAPAGGSGGSGMIPGIPALSYDGNNVAYFAQVLDAVLQGLCETSDKARLTAYSGEGNRFCWTDGAWVFGNECMNFLNEVPFEAEMRTIDALGWRAEYFTVLRNEDGSLANADIAQLRQAFTDAIDRGVAVMPAWDHFQPGYTVFFGYEDGGRKMIGWDYQNNNAKPFTWEDWEQKITSYIILREKGEGKTERDAALDTFAHIVRHARRTDEVKGRLLGFAAWESFLRHLEHDDFSKCPLLAKRAPAIDGNAQSVEHRFIIYCDALCQIYERKNALPYYQSLAERFPEWRDDLNAAVAALDACASYGGFLWKHGFSFKKAGYRRFKTPKGRKLLAEAGREAMRKDMFAVEQFEKILQKEEGYFHAVGTGN